MVWVQKIYNNLRIKEIVYNFTFTRHFSFGQVDDTEVMKRQEYLKAQRDKLLALKKQEREKQLQAVESGNRQRPRSAKAAKSALAGEPENNAQTLQVRKALAERLRSEVVGRKF
jgi:hypothetical protein